MQDKVKLIVVNNIEKDISIYGINLYDQKVAIDKYFSKLIDYIKEESKKYKIGIIFLDFFKYEGEYLLFNSIIKFDTYKYLTTAKYDDILEDKTENNNHYNYFIEEYIKPNNLQDIVNIKYKLYNEDISFDIMMNDVFDIETTNEKYVEFSGVVDEYLLYIIALCINCNINAKLSILDINLCINEDIINTLKYFNIIRKN